MTRANASLTSTQSIHSGHVLVDEGYSPKQIEDFLSKDDKFAGRLPTLRTIQRIVADRLNISSTGPFEIAPSEGIDGEIVLDLLANLIAETSGRVFQLTSEEARWVTAIHRVRPTLPVTMSLYRIARSYMTARSRKDPTLALDAFLAYRPWENKWNHHAYLADILFRHIPPVSLSIVNFFPRFPPFPPFHVCFDGKGWCTVLDYAPRDDEGVPEPMNGAMWPLREAMDAVPYSKFCVNGQLAKKTGQTGG